jgi:hypothetical protein
MVDGVQSDESWSSTASAKQILALGDVEKVIIFNFLHSYFLLIGKSMTGHRTIVTACRVFPVTLSNAHPSGRRGRL